MPATPAHPAYTVYTPADPGGAPPSPVTLVVLHGIGGNGPGMAPLLPVARAQGWTVIAPTIPYGDWRDPAQLTGEGWACSPSWPICWTPCAPRPASPSGRACSSSASPAAPRPPCASPCSTPTGCGPSRPAPPGPTPCRRPRSRPPRAGPWRPPSPSASPTWSSGRPQAGPDPLRRRALPDRGGLRTTTGKGRPPAVGPLRGQDARRARGAPSRQPDRAGPTGPSGGRPGRGHEATRR